jgi:amino-acid N-acetyltransferase
MPVSSSAIAISRAHTIAERQEVFSLLQQANLPIEDIDQQVQLFMLHHQQIPTGTTGWYRWQDVALLRSMSIIAAYQGKGMGKVLYNSIEQLAIEEGIRQFYLLTTTAVGFFAKAGFMVTDRNLVPEALLQLPAFAYVCPSTAIVMQKII